MRICYLILVHQKFDQALRMVQRLNWGDPGFIFHIDSAVDSLVVAAFKAQLQGYKRVSYARRVRSRWGGYPQALAIMHCVQTAATQIEAFDRYVLLSGQDYPIADRANFEALFAKNTNAEYIEAYPQDVMDDSVEGWSPYYRFRRYHVWIGNRHIKIPILRKGLPPLPIYHGSTWWALTHSAISYLAKEFDSNRALRRYLLTGFLVDEVYVPTLIMASPLALNVVGENVTYAKWTPTSGPHPKTLRIDDLNELLNSKKLFARKFDATSDQAILDTLDGLHRGNER